MNKHTPFPWVAGGKWEGDPNGEMEISGPGGEVVVGGCGCCESPFGNADHNKMLGDRALILAIPDMVDALIAARRYIIDCGMFGAIDTINAALEKAGVSTENA